MKIKVTINLGNFENVTLESSEHPTAIECVAELTATAPLFRDPHVSDFTDRVFGRQ